MRWLNRKNIQETLTELQSETVSLSDPKTNDFFKGLFNIYRKVVFWTFFRMLASKSHLLIFQTRGQKAMTTSIRKNRLSLKQGFPVPVTNRLTIQVRALKVRTTLHR
ncbi:MAG: hypothetical protein DSZ28_07760 [Thiothrix sp.]|nr:MAG: hypothetical protein DSZ28_07760 [Thiothrix sp.]